jgi:glycosyltransferase involved in cell wall biosynthesis
LTERPFVVACIPAYNEEKSIASVVLKTLQHVDRVIVCDDGSIDMTSEIAEKLGADVIKHSKNMGYGAAISSLFKEALKMGADVAVTLDGDGQHDPADIPRLIEPLVDGEADIVIGSRFLREKDIIEVPRYRRVGIEFITKLASGVSFKGLTDAQSGFRAYNRRALESLVHVSEMGMGVSTEILLKARKAGLRVVEVPVRIRYEEGSSTHNPFLHGLEVVLSTVKHLSMRRPLVFYGIPGFFALLVALFFWLWTLKIFTVAQGISTNIALIALGATLVGLMLMTTAIILWVLISVLRERL